MVIGMRWLGMLFAPWFLPGSTPPSFSSLGGWFDDGLFLDSTPFDGEHSELYWKSCLSCGKDLSYHRCNWVMVIFPTPTVPRLTR